MVFCLMTRGNWFSWYI